MIEKITHVSLHTPELFWCNFFYSHLFLYTFQCRNKQTLFLVGCLLFLLWFIFFNVCVTIAITGHTNATLVSNECLEVQKWDTVENSLSIKKTYWNKNELVETNNRSQTIGKSDEPFVTPLHN